MYQQPPAAQYPPDPRVWAQTPAPEPEGPSRYLPYGDDATTQFVGVDDLVTQAADEPEQQDAFAHLFRDQQGAAPVPPPGGPQEPAPAPPPRSRAGHPAC